MKDKLAKIATISIIASLFALMIYALYNVRVYQRERNEVYCIEGIAYNRINGGYIEVNPPRKCIVESQ